jgi:thiol-disulfide isomerase/thioredoxin
MTARAITRLSVAWLAFAWTAGLLMSPVPTGATDSGAEVPVGGALREATLQGLNGPPRRLSAYRGRPLIINVWASWCGPCREEMQSLERLAWSGHRQEFAIIGISTDDYPEQALSLLGTSHATISQFIDTDQQMENMLGATRLPLTVLVGPDGRVLQKIYGARDWDGSEALRLIARTFGKGP